MYAIIEDGGRQLKVAEGQEVNIDYRAAEAGQEVKFERVLAFSSDDGLKLGTPALDGASVVGQVIDTRMGDKIVIRKFRRRKTYRRKQGHRQLFNRVKITKIDVP